MGFGMGYLPRALGELRGGLVNRPVECNCKMTHPMAHAEKNRGTEKEKIEYRLYRLFTFLLID